VTTAASGPSTDTPKRGLKAAAIVVAAHVVVVLVAVLTDRAIVFLSLEALLGIAAVGTSMALYRKEMRYTGIGLMGGFVGGLVLVALIQAIA